MTAFRSPLVPALLLASLLGSVSSADLAAREEGSADPAAKVVERTTVRGPVTATVRLEPTAPRIGDVLTLAIEVASEPEVEVLMPAFGEALGQFVILDFSPRERRDEQGRTVRTHRYSLDVPMSGNWSIPPLLVEFVDRRPDHRPAPEGEDAYELLTERIDFTVSSVLPSAGASEFVPPLGELPRLPTPMESARPWIFGGTAFVIVVGTTIVLLLRAAHRKVRKSPYEVAIARLRALQEFPRATEDEIDRFYVELSGIVRRYLEEQFELRAPESTTEEFLDRASRSTALTDDHRSLLVGFLQRADLVKFAHQMPGDLEIAESVRSAERFLEDTREDLPSPTAVAATAERGEGGR